MKIKSINTLTYGNYIELILRILLWIIYATLIILVPMKFAITKDLILLGVNNIRYISLDSVYGFKDWFSILLVITIAIIVFRNTAWAIKTFGELLFGQLRVLTFDDNSYQYTTIRKANSLVNTQLLIDISNNLGYIADRIEDEYNDNNRDKEIQQE